MNKTQIQILDNPHLSGENFTMTLASALEHVCHLRTARKSGDIEIVNQTQLGNLIRNNIAFKKVLRHKPNRPQGQERENDISNFCEQQGCAPVWWCGL